MNQMTLRMKNTATHLGLFLALELSEKCWTLLFGDGVRVREVKVPVGNVEQVVTQAAKARQKFGLPTDCALFSCYEAGRDGFWVHRALEANGFKNVVIDPASIEVDRRMRRAKTDKLDARKLLQQLIRHHRGETPLRTVVVPSPEVEDARRDGRELERLKKERTAHLCRIKSLLLLQGVRDFELSKLDKLVDWQGQPLPPRILAELEREKERLKLVQAQVQLMEKQRHERLQKPTHAFIEKVVALTELRGIGETSAWLFVQEFFGWREFRNRRQVGAAAGLTCSPYDSGLSERQQGISKAGNRRVRTMAVQIAWGWLRFQPTSVLSQWFFRRFGDGKRLRRVGIIALARRLLIALWRYVEHGVIPDGAIFKKA